MDGFDRLILLLSGMFLTPVCSAHTVDYHLEESRLAQGVAHSIEVHRGTGDFWVSIHTSRDSLLTIGAVTEDESEKENAYKVKLESAGLTVVNDLDISAYDVVLPADCSRAHNTRSYEKTPGDLMGVIVKRLDITYTLKITFGR